ncbi:MAG: hypothetical protein WB660_21680 [Candidatus Sulfotelmatobacter sp.]
MLGLKLVHLIERHSEELALGLTQEVRNSERTCDFKKIPRDELHSAASEVYRNLEEWLLEKKEDDVGKRFRAIASRRAAQGVSLRQLVWALVISRNHLWHFLQRECFVDNLLEVFGELEVLQLLNQFFDRAMYYSILGYEEAVSHDQAGDPGIKGKSSSPATGIGMNSHDAPRRMRKNLDICADNSSP